MSERLTAARPLGATGVTVPLLGYGTAPLGKEEKIPQKKGVQLLNHAIDLGITYLDTSPDYGSEPVVGEVMKTRRSEVFLATKVNCRRRDSVVEEVKKSLKRLQTDYVDLIQVHAVNAFADLEQTLAPDGAAAGLEKAREQGLVRYIGITGHARPEVLAHALTRYPFDTVLIALGMADRLVSGADTFFLPKAIEKNAGVIAMKVMGHGCFPDKKLALRYSLNLPGVSLAILGMTSEKEIEENIAVANSLEPLEEREESKLIEQIRPLLEKDYEESQNEGQSSLFWLHDTKVMGWQEDDEPRMVPY
jgi:uncharacterized protein